MLFYHRVINPKDADRIANSIDPDQTAQELSDLDLHCLLRLSVRKLWIITVRNHLFILIYLSRLMTKVYLSHLMRKPTKWHMCSAKTQISLVIRPVWSEFSLSAWRKLGSLSTDWAHSEDSDQTHCADAQADLSLRWAHSHFVGFVMRWLMYFQRYRVWFRAAYCIAGGRWWWRKW